MDRPQTAEFLADCFWPGVTEAEFAALDQRAEASAAEPSREAENVRYLGSLLMREDEVVLCPFEGSEPPVRRAAERAAIPFEGILDPAGSSWSGRRPV